MVVKKSNVLNLICGQFLLFVKVSWLTDKKSHLRFVHL